jgi:hypothetical protein
MSLLNRIAIADGGAEGTLKTQVRPGMASDGLYSSILYFQKRQFPGKPSGFVDPGGPVLAKLESLASRSAVAPSQPGQWDGIKSESVMSALREALAVDSQLDHSDVVDIIRSTLSDGLVSADELDDLSTIADISRTISKRSQYLLQRFVGQVSRNGPLSLPSAKQREAADAVCDFLQREGVTYFPQLQRDEIGISLLLRIAKPSLMDQNPASVCGPADLLFTVASDDPRRYAWFAIDLFEKGRASIGRFLIVPGSGVRSYAPAPGAMDQADWMTMASIRDSENAFLAYDTVDKEFAGITLPGTLADWFSRAGYSDVQEETNLYFTKGTGTIDDANHLFAKGYRIALFINAHMLTGPTQSNSSVLETPDHWVVLRSPIDQSGGKVRLKIFTWGNGDYQIPQGDPLSVNDFLGNFYGYVAAKP